MKPNKRQQELMEKFWMDGFSDVFEKIKAQSGKMQTTPELVLPPDQVAFDAMACCLNGRSKTLQWRKTKPDGDHAGLLWQLVKFYRGNGNLHGYPMLYCNREELDQFDTLAQVILYAIGQPNTASAAWERAIG